MHSNSNRGAPSKPAWNNSNFNFETKNFLVIVRLPFKSANPFGAKEDKTFNSFYGIDSNCLRLGFGMTGTTLQVPFPNIYLGISSLTQSLNPMTTFLSELMVCRINSLPNLNINKVCCSPFFGKITAPPSIWPLTSGILPLSKP